MLVSQNQDLRGVYSSAINILMNNKTCYVCGGEYLARDSWDMTCSACAKLPTVAFRLVANDKYGCPYTVLTGRTVQEGRTSRNHPGVGLTSYDTIRRWAADALAHGSTGVRLELSRHTRELGWSDHNYSSWKDHPYRTVRLDVTARAFGVAS